MYFKYICIYVDILKYICLQPYNKALPPTLKANNVIWANTCFTDVFAKTSKEIVDYKFYVLP